MNEYLPVVLSILLAVSIGFLLLFAGYFLGPKEFNDDKYSPYECGFDTFGDARMQFDVRYYLVAILFVLFDIEIAFLFPWAMVQEGIGWIGFSSIFIFLSILTIGFIYEWKKGALDWD